jgi:tryptophan synthase
MGVTGSSATGKMSLSLPELCARVRKYAGKIPIAVGFGVNTRDHFLSVGNLADGVVIGSKIVNLLKEAPPGKAEGIIRDYCKEISRPRAQNEHNGASKNIGLGESIEYAKTDRISTPTATISRPEEDAKGIVDELSMLKDGPSNGTKNYAVFASQTTII